MGWSRVPGDVDQFYGDQGLDAFTSALEVIAEGYVARFGRPPMLREILYTCELVLRSNAEELLADPEALEAFSATTLPASHTPVLPDDFEAAFDETPAPGGSYPIWRKSTKQDVIRCFIKAKEGTLFIDYERLDKELTTKDVEALIISTILKIYTGDHFASEALHLSLAEASTPAVRRVIPYPRT